MSISSSINMKNTTIEILNYYTNQSGLNQRTIILWFLYKLSNDKKQYMRLKTPIEYQKLLINESFKTIFIRYSDEEYEMSLDLRKLFKKTISLLIPLGFTLFGQEFKNIFCKKSGFISTQFKKILPAFHYTWKYSETKSIQKITLITKKTYKQNTTHHYP